MRTAVGDRPAGFRRPDQVEAILAAAGLDLDDADAHEIENTQTENSQTENSQIQQML